MTIEEKAKRFDETLEQLKGLIEVTREDKCDIAEEDIIDIFPELKESEDEKIRKWLIAQLELKSDVNNPRNLELMILKSISWLEKQGEPIDINPSEFDLRLNKLLKQFETLPKEELASSLSFYLNVVQNDGTYREEKQGEQKPADKVEPKFKVGDYIERKDGLGCHAKIFHVGGNVYGCEKLIYPEDSSPFFDLMFKNQDEFKISPDFQKKPAKEVEPKFHEGDWVVLSTSEGEKVVQIDSIEYFKSGEPRYITSEGRWFGNGTKAHLWTIKDAKDGDVLASELCDSIILFKGINDDNNIDFYCDYDFSEIDVPGDRFAINNGQHYGNVEVSEDFHPATKEQRDTLMKAMTDAGYAFDFKKLELKKIVVPIFNIGDTIVEKDLDECSYGTIKDIKNGQYIFTDGSSINIDEQEEWQLKTSTNIEQKPAEWSEEDEKMRNNLIRLLIRLSACTHTNSTSPSYSYPCEIDWLKSLRPQNHWKPTEEQMIALRQAISGCSYDIEPLLEIEEQLKQL